MFQMAERIYTILGLECVFSANILGGPEKGRFLLRQVGFGFIEFYIIRLVLGLGCLTPVLMHLGTSLDKQEVRFL